ncbi:Maf family protein [Rhodococcus aerolatus]
MLRAAGVEPTVHVSGIDEDALTAALGEVTPAALVAALARAKAVDVAAAHRLDDAVVVGCDSMLHLGDAVLGKPHTVEVARERWRAMAGRSGDLLTGHCVLRVRAGEVVAEAAGTQATTVRFASPTDAEVEAYLATGEPLEVAGAFTLDGLGGWFVEGIDGDPSSVVGISLPLLRRLLTEVGTSVIDLWS